MTDGAIIIGGIKRPVPNVPVVTWEDHGCKFNPPNAPPRILNPRFMIVHWTAEERTGERGMRIMHAGLTSRGLSVEFMITNEGTIWQFVDPLAQRCRHASRVNPFSVGVEVSGLGWAKKAGHTAKGDTARRRTYEASIHGWKTTWYDFLDEEYTALFGLADVLTTHLPIARNVATQPWGRRPDEFFLRESGITGHLHAAVLSKRNPKCDPGTAPLIRLAEHFAS